MVKTENAAAKETKETKKSYRVDLDVIPNGRRKPTETCSFISKMKNWREESARSTLLIR